MRAGPSGARSCDYAGPELVPWLRAADEAAELGWPDPVRTEIAGQQHHSRASGPSRRTRWPRSAGCRTAKVKVAEPGGGSRRRPGPGRGGTRRPRPRRPDPGRRQRGLVRSTRPQVALAGTAPLRAGVRRAALPHGRGTGRAPPPAGPRRDRRADRGGRVDPPGRRPLPGGARGKRPTSPCSRSSRWAASAPAWRSPSGSGCRWWSPARWRPRSDSGPGWRWPRPCRNCPTPAG